MHNSRYKLPNKAQFICSITVRIWDWWDWIRVDNNWWWYRGSRKENFIVTRRRSEILSRVYFQSYWT